MDGTKGRSIGGSIGGKGSDGEVSGSGVTEDQGLFCDQPGAIPGVPASLYSVGDHGLQRIRALDRRQSPAVEKPVLRDRLARGHRQRTQYHYGVGRLRVAERKLEGSDFLKMRQRMGLSRKKLSLVLKITDSTLSVWEKKGMSSNDPRFYPMEKMMLALPWVDEFNQGRTRFLDWET